MCCSVTGLHFDVCFGSCLPWGLQDLMPLQSQWLQFLLTWSICVDVDPQASFWPSLIWNVHARACVYACIHACVWLWRLVPHLQPHHINIEGWLQSKITHKNYVIQHCVPIHVATSFYIVQSIHHNVLTFKKGVSVQGRLCLWTHCFKKQNVYLTATHLTSFIKGNLTPK